jgi:2-polyprenyl-6-methoxyphenol hydroxylase-like FAD-dependent oxidoreductase
MARCERILVVGGGIAGLTAAIALDRHGYRAAVIERTAGWEPLGAGLGLAPNAMGVFASLGVAADLDAVGHVQRSMAASDRTGAGGYTIDLANVWPAGTHQLAIARAELLRVLLDHQPNPVRWGCTPVSLHPAATEVVVELSDGTTSGYDLVIGADGVRSQIRGLLFPSASVRFLGQVYWRGCLDATVVDDWTTQFGGERFFGMSPVAPGRLYWFASQLGAPEPADDDLLGSIASLRATYADFGAPAATVLAMLDEGDEVHFGPVYEVDCEQWVRGSVVLIGDAAHCVSPIAAQGGGMAVEDAAVLADELAAAEDVAAALVAFVERRRPRTDYVRDYSHRRLRTLNVGQLPAPSDDTVRRVADLLRAEYEPLSSPP